VSDAHENALSQARAINSVLAEAREVSSRDVSFTQGGGGEGQRGGSSHVLGGSGDVLGSSGGNVLGSSGSDVLGGSSSGDGEGGAVEEGGEVMGALVDDPPFSRVLSGVARDDIRMLNGELVHLRQTHLALTRWSRYAAYTPVNLLLRFVRLYEPPKPIAPHEWEAATPLFVQLSRAADISYAPEFNPTYEKAFVYLAHPERLGKFMEAVAEEEARSKAVAEERARQAEEDAAEARAEEEEAAAARAKEQEAQDEASAGGVLCNLL